MPGMQLIIKVLAMGVGALVVNNYFKSAALISTDGIPQAITIAIVMLLIEMYLPLAEAWVESRL